MIYHIHDTLIARMRTLAVGDTVTRLHEEVLGEAVGGLTPMYGPVCVQDRILYITLIIHHSMKFHVAGSICGVEAIFTLTVQQEETYSVAYRGYLIILQAILAF